MRAKVRLLALAGLIAEGSVMTLAAQPSPDAGRAISTVMAHRRNYLADSLPFDACSIQRSVGGGGDFVSRLSPAVRGLLDDASSDCPRQLRQGRSVAVVDSVRFAGETVRVYLTVLRGELIHREDYALQARAGSAAFMPVREVRMWGHGQAYSGGRRPPGAGPPR